MVFEVSPELIYAIGTYGNIEQIKEDYNQNNIEPEIMFELTGERSSNIKQFMLEDNSHKLVLYNEDIHYSENGQSIEIEISFVLMKGQAKIVHIDAEGNVTKLIECTSENSTDGYITETVSMTSGQNRLKIVGFDCKILI